MYRYEVYFEGRTYVYSKKKLTEQEVFDEAADIISSDARSRLDNDCNIVNMEILDEETKRGDW